MAFDISKIKAQEELFHNEWIPVYPDRVSLDKISYWPENLRTVLDFDILEEKTGKKLKQLSTKDITIFLMSRYEMHLPELLNSIKQNGVRVPLIVLDDGTLLDGNRRYFACVALAQEAEQQKRVWPDVLNKIPVWIIKSKDINESKRIKILAEANFVKDLKVEWPLDVKARVIRNAHKTLLANGNSYEDSIETIVSEYGEKKAQIVAYLETMEIVDEYLQDRQKHAELILRQHVQSKFVYFWEFRNKALKGRGALESAEMPKVKNLFFSMIRTDRFKNLKQVEPMIKAIRDPYSWKLLKDSKGDQIDQVSALYAEKKAIRSAEDKIRNFSNWLQKEAEPSSFTIASFALLEKLASAVSKIVAKGTK